MFGNKTTTRHISGGRFGPHLHGMITGGGAQPFIGEAIWILGNFFAEHFPRLRQWMRVHAQHTLQFRYGGQNSDRANARIFHHLFLSPNASCLRTAIANSSPGELVAVCRQGIVEREVSKICGCGFHEARFLRPHFYLFKLVCWQIVSFQISKEEIVNCSLESAPYHRPGLRSLRRKSLLVGNLYREYARQGRGSGPGGRSSLGHHLFRCPSIDGGPHLGRCADWRSRRTVDKM